MDTLHKANLTETDQKRFHYSSCGGNITKDVESVDQEEEKKKEDTLTDFQGFMVLLPAFIGVGFLGLPFMVRLLGLWGGSSGLLFYGILTTIGSLVLVGSTRRLTERTGQEFDNMGSLTEMCMAVGPPCVQQYAGKSRLFVDCCILVTYSLLLPDLTSLMNMFGKDVLHQYVDISDTICIIAISLLLLPVYLTRRMKLISFLSTTGNTVLLGIFLISFQYICRDLPDIRTRSPIKYVDIITFTTFANDSMFSYGGIALILPVRSKMKNQKNFDSWNGILGLALVFVTSFHVGCGFFGYLQFGEMTQVNYLLNLPGNNWIYTSLKICSFLTIYCTMGTAVFLVVDTIWPPLKKRFDVEFVQIYGEYICRLVLLIFTCTCTILVPDFELLMSLTGCCGVMFTTLPLPYIITLLVLYGEDEPKSPFEKIKRKLSFFCCIIMVVFGIYSTVTGIGVALYKTLFHIVI